MFYSHEILTSREHGVATVWLVATLGSKSTTRKVNRRAILDVDVPKACGMIIHPEAPMALRLQGNLLYGVSKVYSQQCGYALVDAQSTRDRMMAMLKAIEGAGLDPEAGKARSDQIDLPHDPTFIPELMLPGLNVDLSCLDLGLALESPRKSSLLSNSLPELAGSGCEAPEPLHLNLSSSDIGVGMVGGIPLTSEMSSTRKGSQIELPPYASDEAGVLLQPDFEFDGEGNIVELLAKRTPEPQTASKKGVGEFGEELKVRRDIGLDADELQFDGNVAPLEPEVRRGEEDGIMNVSDEIQPYREQQQDLEDSAANEKTAETGEVKMRYQRQIKTVTIDDPAELRNSDLAQWNSEYAQNMAIAARLKYNNRLITVAKKNAAFWVLGSGIGDVGLGLGTSRMPHPLVAFSGNRLLETLTGASYKRLRRKRSRNEANDGVLEEQKRSVRMRSGEREINRGSVINMDEAIGLPFDDVEIGRHGAPSLHDDPSSHMPWNITASVKSSAQASSVYSRQAMANVGGYPSTGRPRSMISPGPDGASHVASGGLIFGPRRGRLTSASPLAGRGRQADIQLQEDEMDIDTFDDIDAAQSLGGEAHQNEQNLTVGDVEAEKPKWLTDNINQESVNFYEYLKDRLDCLPSSPQIKPNVSETTRSNTGISFSSLLPPGSNTRIIATQALLHILTLATNGALKVNQDTVIEIPKGAQDAGDIFVALAE